MRHAPELLHDLDQRSAAPTVPATSLFGDIPTAIWTAFLSLWALLFGLFLVFFTNGGPASLAVLTASFFALALLGLPAALAAQTSTGMPVRSQIVVTRNGPLPVRAAATQILLIPIASVIGVVGFILLAM